MQMLEFYGDRDGAREVLNNYAYDEKFPSNPNAHVYLYNFLKREKAPREKLISVLKVGNSYVSVWTGLGIKYFKTFLGCYFPTFMFLHPEKMTVYGWYTEIKTGGCGLQADPPLINYYFPILCPSETEGRGSVLQKPCVTLVGKFCIAIFVFNYLVFGCAGFLLLCVGFI